MREKSFFSLTRAISTLGLWIGFFLTTGLAYSQEGRGGVMSEVGDLHQELEVAVRSKNVRKLAELTERALKAGDVGVRQLCMLLGHDDPDVVELTADVLTQVGGAAGVRALIARVEEETSLGRRENLRRLLGSVRNPAATEPLFEAWLSSGAEDVRASAGEALTRIGDENVVRSTEAILEGEADEILTRRAMRVVGEITNPASAPYLGMILLRTRKMPLLVASAVALGRIGTREALRYLLGALGQLDEQRGMAVAQGLRYAGRREALPILLEVIRGSWPDAVRESAAVALRNFGGDDVVKLIEEQLGGEVSPSVRAALESSREKILLRERAEQR